MTLPVYAANEILDSLKVSQDDLVKYLNELARTRGALVFDGRLEGSVARLNMMGNPAIITVSTNVTNVGRRRFCVAHELGHLEMHKCKMALCTSADMLEWTVKEGVENLEQQANEFAASLLMPERYFASFCEEEPSRERLAEIANQFAVSLTATAIRYCFFTPEPVAIVFSQDGYIKWFRASKEFEEMGLFVNVRGRVSEHSWAVIGFDGQTIPRKSRRINADAWLRPGNYSRDATISEQSWAIKSHNAVLSLLWVDENIEDDEEADFLW